VWLDVSDYKEKNMRSHSTEQLKYLGREFFRHFSHPVNKTDLLSAISDMEIQYTAPINNWLYGYFYQYFRTRPETIDTLKNQIEDCNLPNEWLRKLITFFQKGRWTTTSANTYLMQNCLKKLPPIIENKIDVLSFELTALDQILHFFIEQANIVFHSHNIYFIDILKFNFINIYTKINYQASFKKAYDRDLLTRAFDDCPFSIISDEEAEELQTRFKYLLLNIHVNDEIEIINDHDKKKLMHWELTIIDMAINNLLDPSGVIKAELLTMLDCQETFTAQQVIELICAYVGRVNHQIIMQCLEYIQENNKQNTYLSLCNYINKNYGKWVEYSLKKEDKSNNLYLLSAVGVGSSLLISAAAMGIILFKQHNQPIQEENNINSKLTGTKF
jgi:hypothetical protein